MCRGACNCEWNTEVQKVGFIDLGSFGAPTGPMLSFAQSNISTICGAAGLGCLVASEVPTSKGRTSKVLPKAPAVADAALEDGNAVVADVPAARSLPPAPSEFHVYADRGAIRALLANDFHKLTKIGSAVEGRYGETVAFRVKQRPGIRAMCIVPTSNSLWHHTKLLKDRESLESNPPEQAGCKDRAQQYKSGHGQVFSGHCCVSTGWNHFNQDKTNHIPQYERTFNQDNAEFRQDVII
jgi:hypothetical protein